MSVEMKLTGPLFDGTAPKAVQDFITDAEQSIGDYAVNEIQTELGRVLKHPTGYYRGHIQTDLSSEQVSVNDGGVIYGPWLEGVGSRNKRSRFKGYATFRRVSQQLQDRAVGIAEKSLPKLLGRLQ